MTTVFSKYLLQEVEPLSASSLRAYYEKHSFNVLEKALSLTSDEILTELKISGLRGRGGAAFPTWLKWQTVANQKERTRYVVANGEEGEPGTFKDRLLFEQNPLAVLEAMIIAAHTVSATEGFIYLNQNYHDIAANLEQLLSWMRQDKWIGETISGSKFEFDINVCRGGQAYITGEETALFRALEGKRTEPAARPPYPTEQGLWHKPTVINNIETFSCIPLILEKGGAWFAGIGPDESHGPKLFCVSGDIRQPGVYEASMDVTLQQLIDHAGGLDGNFKCAFVSGLSGKLYLADDLNKALNIANGCGNGTIIVKNDSHCAVELARHVTNFFFNEHCGQCLPGRAAMKEVKSLMDTLDQQQHLSPIQQRYSELHEMLVNNSKCGLCSSGTGMAPNLMQAFADDFHEHLNGTCSRCGEADINEVEN